MICNYFEGQITDETKRAGSAGNTQIKGHLGLAAD